MRMEKKSAYNIIGGANHPFSFPVLRRGVRAGEAVGNAVVREEGAERAVDEFATVVALHALNNSVKLSVDGGEETLEGRGCLGFVA